MNGEGNKLTEADSALRAGIGMTFIPVKNLSLRGYFDSMKKRNINQQTLEFIASYENKRFNLSALYNFQKDHNLIPGQDYSGFSVNGSFLLKKNMKLYARFDKLTSEKVEDASNPWNFSKDGILYIAGIEFAPAPGIKFSPNFQCWQPADKNNTFISKFFLSTEIRF